MFGGYIQPPGGGGGGNASFTSGSVLSGTLGDGVVFSGNIASGQIGRFHIASGQLAGFELGSGAIVSGRIASGQIGNNHLAAGAVQSGSVGSGQLSTFHIASGAKVDASEWSIEDTFVAVENISGGRAVAFSQSGSLLVAMPGVSGRMPAIGVVVDNVLATATATVYRGGRVFSTLFNFSGWPGSPLYVGLSGHVVASGAPTASGNIQQSLGVAITGSGAMIQIGDALEGVIAQSGDIGSGAIAGSLGGGFFNVASGTMGTYDAGSGTVVRASQYITPFQSGTSWSLITEEIISGVRAVCISQSGTLRVAMASVSGRMPAIGVVVDGVLSGIPANVYTQGMFPLTSGLADYSGCLGKPVWVGRSGSVVTWSGSFNSAGFNVGSGGDFVQRLGFAVTSGGFVANVDVTMAQNQLLAVTSFADTLNRQFGV